MNQAMERDRLSDTRSTTGPTSRPIGVIPGLPTTATGVGAARGGWRAAGDAAGTGYCSRTVALSGAPPSLAYQSLLVPL